MNKPKYKLGDIVYDRLCNSMELIIAIESSCTSFWYKTIIIDGRRDGKYDLWGRTYIKHMVQRDWQCFGGRVWS